MQHTKSINETTTSQMKSYFFINDYRSILWALTIISKKQGQNIIVITSKELKKFLEYIKENNPELSFTVLYKDFNPAGLYKKKFYTIPSNILKAKKFFKENLNHIKNCDIYFFGIFNVLIFYGFIQRLSKKNQIIYCESPQQLNGILYETNNNNRILRFIVKILFGLNVYFKKFGNTIFPYITIQFFSRNNVTTIKDFDISNDLFSFMKQEQINKDILLLVDDLVKIGFIEKTLFQEDMNQLMRTISNNGLTCSIKPHPFNPQLYGNMKNQKHILPGFIPANYFIISNHWKYIIGLITTALFDAQDQTDAEIICVIDCLHWKNDRDRQHMKNWLLEHNKRILFPRGWDEFDKLLG